MPPSGDRYGRDVLSGDWRAARRPRAQEVAAEPGLVVEETDTGWCGAVVRAISADSRSQARNREIALSRLTVKLAGALRVEAPRRATKPSRGAREDRLRSKQQRSNTKSSRVRPHRDED